MWLIRLYIRVLGQLGSDLRVGAVLALANVGLAIAAFAEPVLFGRIIDRLTGGAMANVQPTFGSLLPLIAAWVGFGLFTIGAAVLVALHADRLSHRRRLATMAENVVNVVAIELAAAAQGCDFHAPLPSSVPLERARALLRERVLRLDRDRYLAPDIAAAAELVRSGALVAAAGVRLPDLEGQLDD